MPIISKETWEKFDPSEQKEIRELYSDLIEAMKKEKAGSENHIAYSIIHDRYISLFGREQLQPLTYEDVARELGTGDFKEFNLKLEAIGKLMAVAKFLNKDWKPDWKQTHQKKFYILIDRDGDIHVDEELDGLNSRIVYFRTEELARQAIQILGDDTVRLALSTDL